MTEKDLEINKRLMTEFNLEPGYNGRICDRETGHVARINGKELLMPGTPQQKHTSEFDPINSVRQMNQLFGSYVCSLQQQGVIEGDIVSYSTIPARYPGKVKAVLKIKPYDSDTLTEIASKPYRNETSAIADLVCQVNGEKVDMTPYDIDRQKQAEQQRKAAQKQMKFKGKKAKK